MTSPLISIVFVNYQSAESLRQALRSLREPLQKVSHEIIVINNDVQDQEKIDQLEKEFEIIVEHLSANFGFSKANNLGAKRTTGEILLFLNPDTCWREGSFLSLVACLKSQEEALFGMRLLSSSGKDEPWSCGEFPTLSGLFWRKLTTLVVTAPWEQRTFHELDWVSGAGLAIARSTYEKLGGFDEAYFLYYEDVDLSARAKQIGVRTFRFPFLEFSHGRGQSHTSRQAMKQAYYTGQKMYFMKHRPILEYKILTFLHWLFRNV